MTTFLILKSSNFKRKKRCLLGLRNHLYFHIHLIEYLFILNDGKTNIHRPQQLENSEVLLIMPSQKRPIFHVRSIVARCPTNTRGLAQLVILVIYSFYAFIVQKIQKKQDTPCAQFFMNGNHHSILIYVLYLSEIEYRTYQDFKPH